MPTTANDLVKKLMAKAGVTYDGDLAVIPDDIATSLDNALLTEEAAKNNHPKIRNFYTAQVYNGVDAELNRIMAELNLPEDAKAEIMQAGVTDDKPSGSTVKRITALTKKVKELNDKSNPADKDATKRLNDTITELNGKLAAEITKQTNLKTEYDNQLKGIKIKTKLSGMLNTYKTVYDELPSEAKEAAIDALLNKSLQDSDADFAFDDKGNLSLIKKDGSNLFGDNHTLITPHSFIDKTLSKILKVTDPKTGNPSPAPALKGNEQQPNPNIAAAVKESLDAYKTALNGQAVIV